MKNSTYTKLETILITAMKILEIPSEIISGTMCALTKESQQEALLNYLIDTQDQIISKNTFLKKVLEISQM